MSAINSEKKESYVMQLLWPEWYVNKKKKEDCGLKTSKNERTDFFAKFWKGPSSNRPAKKGEGGEGRGGVDDLRKSSSV